jgi:hypothetical protein
LTPLNKKKRKFEALLASEEAVRRLPLRERMKLHFVRRSVKRTESNSKVFDAGLLDVCLLDLIRKPVRTVRRLCNHSDAAGEAVDTLGATLT